MEAVSEFSTPSEGSGGTPTPTPQAADLARRVALRRRQLGLTRKEVANRAGMAPRYLQLLEEVAADFDTSGLQRLASALEMTPRELLEGSTDAPPGQGAAAPRAVLWKLGSQECRDRLGTHGVGRLGLATPQGPAVLPVNYTVLGGTLVYRTAAGTVTAAADGSEVAFEVDHVDDAQSQGWSVLVVGTAEHVTEPDTVRRLAEQSVTPPWAGGKRDLWVRIDPKRVTGRIIRTA